MLLRSITKNVKNQNWFAVWIDFVIVVIGVFIGIQVANWNEDRTLAEQERQLLQAILEDLKTDQEILVDGMGMAQASLSATHYVLKAAGLNTLDNLTLPVPNLAVLGGDEFAPLPIQSILETERIYLWKYLTIHYYPDQSNAALEALIAAGNLGLIKESNLMRDLQKYQLLWDTVETSNNRTFRPYRDRVVYIGQQFGLSPFAAHDENSLVELFKKNPELTGAVRTLAEFTRLHHGQMESIAERAQTLTDRIESILE